LQNYGFEERYFDFIMQKRLSIANI